MLVVSRKQGQKVLVAPDIEIVVVAIRPDRVRIGIKAPDGTKILREELIEKEVKA